MQVMTETVYVKAKQLKSCQCICNANILHSEKVNMLNFVTFALPNVHQKLW